MRLLGKKQETFKQLHQEKQHTKRARKSPGQNIRDLNRKAATVLNKICAPTLLSNFKLQTSTHVCLFFSLKSEDVMYARAHTPMKPNLEETLAKNGRKTFKVKCFFSGLLILNETQGERGILYINGIFTIVKPCWKQKEPASSCRKVCISSKWMRAAMCNVWDKTRSTCWQVVQARKGAKSRANRTQSLIPAAGLGGCNERCPSVRW